MENYKNFPAAGENIYELAKKLWPLCRSITGPGILQTLSSLKEIIPLDIHLVPSGTQCFDWVIPKEWEIRDAWIKNSRGEKIVDFNVNNLHIMSYSTPVHKKMSLAEISPFLYSLPKQPEAIPYITSYYKERWGFCISHQLKTSLKEDHYEVFIDSTLKEGSLPYGECFFPGKSSKEIFFSTYVCHPSMGNNELSGPCLGTYLAKYVEQLKNRHYSYRFVFIPETIGSICYLSRNLKHLKESVIAGFNLTCVGDNLTYSFLPSRKGGTLSDRIAESILDSCKVDYKSYSFLDRGSDERQYCAPGVDLPIVSLMRSKYAEYPEYHTSLDDLNFISAEGLAGSYKIHTSCIDLLEKTEIYQSVELCEPQLGKRGLYPQISTLENKSIVADMMNFLAYCDGQNDLSEISKIIKVPVEKIKPIAEQLLNAQVIRRL